MNFLLHATLATIRNSGYVDVYSVSPFIVKKQFFTIFDKM